MPIITISDKKQPENTLNWDQVRAAKGKLFKVSGTSKAYKDCRFYSLGNGNALYISSHDMQLADNGWSNYSYVEVTDENVVITI